MVSIEGKLKVGARLNVRARLGEREMGFSPTLVHVDERTGFRWLGYTLAPWVFRGEHSFELESHGDTRTRLVHAEKFGGILAGLTLALIGKQTEQGFRDMNQALKERCETPPGSGPSSV